MVLSLGNYQQNDLIKTRYSIMDRMIEHELDIIEKNIQQQELLEDFQAIQMARTPEVLRKFVVGAHAKDHPAQGWAQCVLELQIKYDDIRRARINAELIQLDIDELESQNTTKTLLTAKLRRIDLEAQHRAMIGAIREFQSLYEIYKNFGQRYTREELNDAQVEYWRNRVMRQASQEQQSKQIGIGAGNLEALQELGISPSEVSVKQELLPIAHVEDRFLNNSTVEQRYLEVGKQRVLIVSLSANKEQPSSIPVLERPYTIPAVVERRLHCIYGMTIDRGYTEAVMMAFKEGATHLMCIEDDTFPPLDAIEKLLAHDKDVVCGWYPKRQPGPRVGVPIILQDNKRCTLDNPESYTELVQLYTAPMGCTLFKTNIFEHIEMPWFVTTGQLTQDSFFSQKAREAGYELWCDTSIRCEHIDRDTGIVYK